jgi:hypothetical protein
MLYRINLCIDLKLTDIEKITNKLQQRYTLNWPSKAFSKVLQSPIYLISARFTCHCVQIECRLYGPSSAATKGAFALSFQGLVSICSVCLQSQITIAFYSTIISSTIKLNKNIDQLPFRYPNLFLYFDFSFFLGTKGNPGT